MAAYEKKNEESRCRTIHTHHMRPMRKANRQKDAGWALEVFDKAPYMTLSMTRQDGTPITLTEPPVGKSKP